MVAPAQWMKTAKLLQLSGMAMESSIGQMAHTMRASGSIIKHRDRELFGTLKVMFTQESLETIWPMDLESTLTLTDPSTKASLETMSKRAMEKRSGLMVPSMSETT